LLFHGLDVDSDDSELLRDLFLGRAAEAVKTFDNARVRESDLSENTG